MAEWQVTFSASLPHLPTQEKVSLDESELFNIGGDALPIRAITGRLAWINLRIARYAIELRSWVGICGATTSRLLASGASHWVIGYQHDPK